VCSCGSGSPRSGSWRRRGFRRAAYLRRLRRQPRLSPRTSRPAGTVALGPLEHAAKQVSQGSVWAMLPRVGLPDGLDPLSRWSRPRRWWPCACGATRRTDPRRRESPVRLRSCSPLRMCLPGYLGWVLPGAAPRAQSTDCPHHRSPGHPPGRRLRDLPRSWCREHSRRTCQGTNRGGSRRWSGMALLVRPMSRGRASGPPAAQGCGERPRGLRRTNMRSSS